MIKKHAWRIIYLFFIILFLINIFQKLKWNAPTDNIVWKPTSEGLICEEAPKQSPIKKGDLLLVVNKYVITNAIDLNRAIRMKKSSLYEIERDGLLRIVTVDITMKYTPLSYYILAFSGIILILLTLSILNTNLKKKRGFSPPIYFYLMSLTFSGLLIFSPTGSYNTMDFFFLILDWVCIISFPALMLHYSLYFPFRLKIVRTQFIRPGFLKLAIYIVPAVIMILNAYLVISKIADPNPEILTLSINSARKTAYYYFSLYLILALAAFITSNLWLILQRNQKRFLFPLLGVGISIPILLLFTLLSIPQASSSLILQLAPFLLVFLPLSLTYYLGHRKFTDIENIIKKTAAVGSVFLFIFGIFFILGSAIEQNKLLGIFWSMATILTAGLLFRPIEETIHKYFEKLFFRGAATFKRKLIELIQSFRNERDVSTIATNFLNTINNGFQLQKSAFIIHHRKNIYYSLPRKKKLFLSNKFRISLFENDNLVFSAAEFQRRFPKDYPMLKDMNYFQFLPLKTQDRLVGLIAFGPKFDDTYLSVEDWEIMFNIASPLTLSVENASLYSELQAQLDEISLLKEFNENIIVNINVGIVVLSTLNIIETWNDFMALKFRIPALEAIDTKAHIIFGLKLWKQIHKKKQDASVSSIHNVKVEIPGDEELVFDIHISPLKDSQGKVVGSILVFEDVTEKLLMENQLLTSEKMASLGVLSAGIAHEVNTPLTGISSYCQFILDNPRNPENIDLVLKIQEQVLRANKIIQTLLDFSRQQKAEIPTELDLNKVIGESIALVEHNLKKKNIKLHKDYDFKHTFFGYSTRLQQMFINLLINASDAITDSNGDISISGIETNSDIMIRIKDNGKGIDPRHIKKIFDPFFTTKEKGKGTGLGLSITYSIVQEHLGEITVNSKLNKGTTFIITFPLKSPLRSMKL
jgi:two-component system NtrC family sensor kinase